MTDLYTAAIARLDAMMENLEQQSEAIAKLRVRTPKQPVSVAEHVTEVTAKPEVTVNVLGEPIKPPTKAERKAGSAALTKWLTDNGIVAKGRAWKESLAGERSVKKLKALNKADNLTFTVAVAVQVDEAEPAKLDLTRHPKYLKLIASNFTAEKALEIVGLLPADML